MMRRPEIAIDGATATIRWSDVVPPRTHLRSLTMLNNRIRARS